MKDYSNYHPTNVKDKIKHDGDIMFRNTLEFSNEAVDVTINNAPHRVVIQHKSGDVAGDKRTIFCYPDLVDRGTILEEGTSICWLVISLPLFNVSYSKATLQRCNAVITIKGERKPIAWDEYSNPIEFSGGEDQNFICVADKSLVYGSANLNDPINIPDNKIKITMPFTEFRFEEFYLYGEPYLVRDTDLTQSINGIGLITITGERKQDHAI